MSNPFEKRATEYSGDSEAFLSIVTPEPLRTFLEEPAKRDALYDRLVVITGTPGSGKTTIATLLQFRIVDALRRNKRQTGYKELVSALSACRAVDDDDRPLVAGVRLPLESEYRDFWELPYSEATRTRLVLALLEARAMLGWLTNLTATGARSLDRIRIVPRADAIAATAAIGGTDATGVRDRAAAVEQAVYEIGAALVPPASEERFADVAKGAYRPFDAIEAFELEDPDGTFRVRPLVMLDDAHTLHPKQFAALARDLARRELRVARWILTRIDILSPEESLLTTDTPAAESTTGGVQIAREITFIRMQTGKDRAAQHRAFVKMARGMADRYLRIMPEFMRRRQESFADLLETKADSLPPGSLRAIEKEVDTSAGRLGVQPARRAAFEEDVRRYVSGATSDDLGEDVQRAMVLVMMHRHAKRVPQGTLFGEDDDREPKTPVKANSGVAEAARIHLLHKYDRPYYFGIDKICDAASDNAEQFLHLAARLVERAENRLMRNRRPTLEARVQHTELKAVAEKILREYDYPFAGEALALADALAKQCLARSLQPNAPLDGGANAIGVPQEAFAMMHATHARLAEILQFAVAYNVVTLSQDYGQGGKKWCLLELGGCVIIKHGLTLHRGGFLERTLDEVAALLPEDGE